MVTVEPLVRLGAEDERSRRARRSGVRGSWLWSRNRVGTCGFCCTGQSRPGGAPMCAAVAGVALPLG
eukprot:9909729-Heterocapsa_arctica.AAC.1